MSQRGISRRDVLSGATAGALALGGVSSAAATPVTSRRALAGAAGRLQSAERGALRVNADPGGYASAESTPALNIPSNTKLTVEMWVKHDGTSDEDAILLTKGELGYQVAFSGSGEDVPIAFGVKYPNDGNWDVISDRGIPAHTWTHVACVYDGSRLTIYIDGETDAQYEGWDDSTIDGNDEPLFLGANQAGNDRFYSGQLDGVRVWNAARTQIEIRETMYETLSGDEDDIVACYSFDGTSDDAARSNHLDLAGTAELVAPGALPATPSLYSRAGNGAVELQWDPRGPAASEYRLYHGTAFDGSDAQPVGTVPGGETSTTIDASNDQVHYYWLSALDADGNEGDVSYPAIAYPSETASGNALSFSGDNSYVEVSDRPRLDVPSGNKLTIEFWVYHDGESDENPILVEDNDPDGDGYHVSLVGTGAGASVWFGVKYPNSGNWGVESEFGIPANTWTHVACVYDGSQQAIYIDGELDATRDDWDDNTVENNDTPFMLGATAQKNERFFSGKLDQVRIWNVARTQEQIEEHYQTELFGNEEGLVGYFRTCDGDVFQGSVGVGQSGVLNNVECTGSDIELTNEVEGSGTDPAGGDSSSLGGDDGGGGLFGGNTTVDESNRGFFTNGETSPSRFLDSKMLTVVGIVMSILGIVYEMVGGGR